MFSIGFWELIIIFAIIVILIKPEHLPDFFRKIGKAVKVLRDIKDNFKDYTDKIINKNEEEK